MLPRQYVLFWTNSILLYKFCYTNNYLNIKYIVENSNRGSKLYNIIVYFMCKLYTNTLCRIDTFTIY